MKIEIQFIVRGNTTVWNGKLVYKGHTIHAKADSPMVVLMMLMASWVESQLLSVVECKIADCTEAAVEKGQRDYCKGHQAHSASNPGL